MSTMSNPISTSIAEKANANSAGRVLLGPCADLLRDILRYYVPTLDFNDVIKQQSHLLPHLTPNQMNVVLPQSGQYTGHYGDMDLSLTYILLTAITSIQPHSQGWGEDPDPGDISVSANIDRIFMVRNILGYWTSEGLRKIDFDILWSTISLAVEYIDVCHNFGSKYIKEVDFLRLKPVDPNDTYYMEELQRQVKYSHEINPWYASTANTTNATRASRVLLGPCTDQLRDVLRKEVPLSHFPTAINGLRGHRSLTPPQRKILYPGNNHYSGNYNDMDITLLYFLLRNIPNLVKEHKKKWGKDPDPSDRSLSANIERIRMARNKIGHSTQSLSHVEFQNLWSTIRSAVVDFDDYLNNDQKFEKVVDFLRKETMDPERDRYFLDEMRKQAEEDQKTREMIQETDKRVGRIEVEQQKIVEEDQKTKKMIVETNQRIDNVEDEIKKVKRAHNLPAESDDEIDVNRLKQRLMEINDLDTQEIPLTPLQEDGNKLPIEQLFASVVIREDSKDTKIEEKSAQVRKQQERKEVKKPRDMLIKNDKPVRRVFMLGDAAHGKTTYCMWLLKKWCNSQQPCVSGRPLNEWESALSEFDFIFHLPLRRVDPSRTSVTDMICHDVLETDSSLQRTVKHVLSSDQYRCFIMIDGLDEWNSNQSVIDHLKHKGMPNIENMSNCVIFTTMRPWMFAAVAGLVRDDDRVIEIEGLDDKGITDVIEKVLLYHYRMKADTDEYKAKCKEIISKLEDKTLKSFIKIPLLAVVCVQIWYGGEQVGNSLTSFYAAMVNMLIERAQLKQQIQKFLKDQMNNFILPKDLSTKKSIKSYINVLIKLGKVAYEGLLSKQMKLVFQKDNLEAEIGEKELQFALSIGLISQKEAPSIFTRKVSVHFLHKSVQEFLSVIYMVTQKDVADSFCNSLSNVKVIMDLSNVIMFICGMSPSLGSVISQRVVSVTDSDTEICKYRKSPFRGYSTVVELYELQVVWYRELQYGQRDHQLKQTDSLMTKADSTVTQTDIQLTQTENPVTFHVSDVYLEHDSKIETVRLTRELLSDHHVDIRSLWLNDMPAGGEISISNTELNSFLSNTDNTRSLVMLYINGESTNRSLHFICGPTLRILYLHHVAIQDIGSGVANHPVLKDMSMIERLELYHVSLGDRDIGLEQQMTDLQEVKLHSVKMTPLGWGRYLQSLEGNRNRFLVILMNTDVDDDTLTTIRSSSNFNVTQDSVNDYGEYVLEFKTVMPLTQVHVDYDRFYVKTNDSDDTDDTNAYDDDNDYYSDDSDDNNRRNRYDYDNNDNDDTDYDVDEEYDNDDDNDDFNDENEYDYNYDFNDENDDYDTDSYESDF